MMHERPRIACRRLAIAALAATLAGGQVAAEPAPPRAGDETQTGIEIWTVPAARKVFREDVPPVEAGVDVRLEAAGGETEAAQVVLRAAGVACTLTEATLSGFRDDQGVVCPEIGADVLQVAFVHLPRLGRDWPDPLPPFRGPLPLAAGKAQPLWLSVRVPPSAAAGVYRATLRLSFDAHAHREVSVVLRVFGFRLPERPSLRTAIGNQMEFVLPQHGVQPGTAEASALELAYYRFFMERRLSPYNPPGGVFSPAAAECLDDPRITSFVIPWTEDDAELQRVIDRLHERDWLKKGFFYVWDEPQTEADFDELTRRARRIRALEPRAAMMVPFNGTPQDTTGRSTYERLDGLVDQWCPLSNAVDVEGQRSRAARGEGSWWYVCCSPGPPRANLMVDWPGTAHRALFWQQKQRGIDGFLYWSATYWDPLYTRDPWTDIHTYTFKGECYGDGSLVYPGARLGIDGPVTSIRLELLRDGMDDFEYLTLFERIRGRDAMEALTRRATTSLDDYATDPLVLDGLRREMAEVIESAAVPPASDDGRPRAGTRPLETPDTIGLANDRVLVAFDRRNGRLRSLRNLVTDDDCLKRADGAGNPFRVHLNPIRVPSALTLAFPWPIQPPDDALGGSLVDPADCELLLSRFERMPRGGRLKLDLAAPDHGLTFDLTISLPDDDHAVDLDLGIRNTGSEPARVLAAIPHLTGLGLGADPTANLGVRLRDFGQTRAPAWSPQGGVYTRDWSMPWNAVSDTASGGTLGMLAVDEGLRTKILRRWPGGGMEIFYADPVSLAPGDTATFPTARLLVARGDWKVTARRYRDWFAATFPLRRPPAWFGELGRYSGNWMPRPADVEAARRSVSGRAATAGVIASFDELPRLYLVDRFDLHEWAQYWQGVVTTGHYDSFNHCDGVYAFRTDLGGADAMRTGVAGVERLGRHVGLYVGAKTVRLDSDLLRDRDPREAMLMETPDAALAPGATSIAMCPADERWQDHLAATCGRLLRETGARFIRLDELGELFVTCHNPAHRHASPSSLLPRTLDLLRKVRAAMDEVDPDALLFTEGAVDLMNLHANGALGIWNAGVGMAPLRLAVPTYQGLAYHYGQIDSALQGFACGTANACSLQGYVSAHHEGIWGVGLEPRPACYPPQPHEYAWPPAPELQWDVLRVTFRDAIEACDPTDVDPHPASADARHRDDWAGRLWRSPQYWLLTCGQRAAERPERPVRVALPELPTDVSAGVEIDCETLAIRPVAVERTAGGCFVDTAFGFSAVLLPRPDCPTLMTADPSPLACVSGGRIDVAITAWSPWRNDAAAPRVTVEAPGLEVPSPDLTVPGTVAIHAPDGTAAGKYLIRVAGDCLPLKRWLDVTPRTGASTSPVGK